MWRNKLSHNWQAEGLFLTLKVYLLISLISINDDDTVLGWKFNGLDAEQSNDQLNYLIPYFYFQLSNYSSLEGVLYCKPHFEQLFKETGSFNKSFQSRKTSHLRWIILLLIFGFISFIFSVLSFFICLIGHAFYIFWQLQSRLRN